MSLLLKRLRLKNICQFTELDWEFQEGLIGIYGPNGSGKTNSINVAGYAALTNDYSRHPKGKAGLIRQMAGKGAKSEISLEFLKDGKPYEIIRGLRAPVQHVLRRPRKQMLTNANEIQRFLYEELGLNKRLIDEHMFVNQWELFAFISAIPSERAKSFAQLCNTIEAEEIWELLKEQGDVDRPLAAEIDDNRDEIRSQIGRYKKKKKKELKALRETESQLLSDQDLEYHTEIVEARRTYERLQGQIQEVKKKEKRALNNARAVVSQEREANRSLEACRVKLATKKEAYEKAKQELATLSSAKKAYKQKRRLLKDQKIARKALKELQEPSKPLGEKQKYENLYWDLVHKIKEAERFLETFHNDEVVECPTCHRAVDAEISAHAEWLENRLPSMRADKEVMSQQIAEFDKYQEDLHEYQSQKTRLEDRLQSIAESLEPLKDTQRVDERKLRGLEIRVENYERLQSQIEPLSETARDLHGEAESAKATHKALKAQLKELKKELEANLVDDEDYDEAVSSLETHEEVLRKIEGHRAVLPTYTSVIEQGEADLRRVEERLKKSKVARQWLRAIQDVRDEVMHRDKLPRIVHLSYLEEIIDKVNVTLGDFGTPFTVDSRGGLQFVARFVDGTEMVDEGLSGGQAVLLAIPFRLTMNSLFAPQLGTMVLDEPTDGLDNENRARAADVFRQLGKIIQGQGKQVIVITHDQALETCFNQKLVLKRHA